MRSELEQAQQRSVSSWLCGRCSVLVGDSGRSYGRSLRCAFCRHALAFACAVLSLVYPFTTSVFHLVLLQLVFGVCQSFCWIGVQTGIGKTYRGDPVVTSHLGFWSMGGTFFGPFIIGFVWDYLGTDSSFVAAALWCGLMSVLALQLSQEVSGMERSASKRQAVKGDYSQAFGQLRDPVVFYIIACSSVRLGAVSLQTSFLPFIWQSSSSARRR